MTSNSPVCYANIPSGTSGRTHTERYSAVQPAGFGKIGMTIEEAADYTGIGRNTLRRLVDWGKIPVLRIGRKLPRCGWIQDIRNFDTKQAVCLIE